MNKILNLISNGISKAVNFVETWGGSNFPCPMVYNGHKVLWEDGNILPFDCGASTPALYTVAREEMNFLKTYGSIHRGAGKYSEKSTNQFEAARAEILELIGGNPERDCAILGNNTSQCISQAALILKPKYALVSDVEHSANKLPWKEVCEQNGGRLFELPTKNSIIDPEELNFHLDCLIKDGTKPEIVALTGASNITGYVTNIGAVHQVCKKYKIPFLLDASQYAPHFQPSLDDCELIAFCGHKMYAPFGGAILAGRKELLRKTSPMTGGGNVLYATLDRIYYKDAPDMHEAGTANGQGLIAMAAACRYLYKKIGHRNLVEHTRELVDAIDYIIPDLEKNGFKVYFGKKNFNMNQTPVLVLRSLYHDQQWLVDKLNKDHKVFCRVGSFCAYRLIERMGLGNPEKVFVKEYKTAKDFIKLDSERSIVLDPEARLDHSYDLIRFSAGLITSVEDVIKLRDLLIKANNI